MNEKREYDAYSERQLPMVVLLEVGATEKYTRNVDELSAQNPIPPVRAPRPAP